ncbi:MAG: S-layer homology domain-containing protein [Oscillospiraceae bacterium]|nr:S-layer homology domain-containing protein [Oscillospiraceae bacterium]
MQKKIRSIISVILAIILSFLSLGFVSAQPSGDDISGTFFETEFRQAVSRGWINGFPDGTFRPNANITRAEIITLLDNALELPVAESGELAFTDVSAGAWFYETLLKFRAHVNVSANNEFRGNTFATREEVCYIIFNLIDTDVMPGTSSFTDAQDISFWAFQAVGVNHALGIVRGYPDGSFAPRQNITRAEAVIIVYRLSQVLLAGEATLDPDGENNEPRTFTLEDIENATGPSLQINQSGGSPSFIGGTFTNVRVFTLEDAILALESIADLMDIYNAAEEFEPMEIRRSALPGQPVAYRFHLQQVHQGIPVHFATVNIRANSNGTVESIASGYRPDVRYAITTIVPTISPEDAMQKADDFFDTRDWVSPGFVRNPHAIEPSLAITANRGLTPRLTWAVPIGGDTFMTSEGPIQDRFYVFYICAHNGDWVNLHQYYIA